MPKTKDTFEFLNSTRDQINLKPAILDEYFGVWAIEEGRFRQSVERLDGINLHAHIEANRDTYEPLASGEIKSAERSNRNYDVTDEGVALVNLRGPLMKFRSSLAPGTSTRFARQQIRQAMDDGQVGAILLVIDSPGGTVAGTSDLAEDVARASAKKPVYAFLEDLTASAAMWIASQTQKIIANSPTALVGSIGTYAVLHDYSGYAEKMGLKVHVVKAGEFKGAGEPGTEITQEQIAQVQSVVDSLNSEFLNAVARGRKMPLSQVQAIADGRIHPANEAKRIGLVDAIQSIDQTLSDLAKVSRPRNSSRSVTMSDSNGVRASIEELQSALPDASADFILSQYSSQATVADASKAYTSFLSAELAKEREEREKQKADYDERLKQLEQRRNESSESDGVVPLGVATDDEQAADTTGDAIADFDGAVRSILSRNAKMSRQEAIIKAAKSHPEMHAAFLMATNQGSRLATRLVGEKYNI